MEIEEREKACLELLGKLPKLYVLVGGYAVSAFEFPRFSVDLDLVIAEKDFNRVEAILEDEGYSMVKETGEFALTYTGRFVSFRRMVHALPVSVDLLVGMLQCRQTDAAYSFSYLRKNSETRVVMGFGVDAAVEARVADREMLMALKINSMRAADQRDIIALSSREVDATKVAFHLRKAPEPIISENIERLLAFLEEPKSRDSLRGVFVFSDTVLAALLKRTRKTLEDIAKRLEG
jgi:hypothetical protein